MNPFCRSSSDVTRFILATSSARFTLYPRSLSGVKLIPLLERSSSVSAIKTSNRLVAFCDASDHDVRTAGSMPTAHQVERAAGMGRREKMCFPRRSLSLPQPRHFLHNGYRETIESPRGFALGESAAPAPPRKRI